MSECYSVFVKVVVRVGSDTLMDTYKKHTVNPQPWTFLCRQEYFVNTNLGSRSWVRTMSVIDKLENRVKGVGILPVLLGMGILTTFLLESHMV